MSDEHRKNLLSGTRDWSGVWNNSGTWHADGTHDGFTVMTAEKNASGGLNKLVMLAAGHTYTFSACVKVEPGQGHKALISIIAGSSASDLTANEIVNHNYMETFNDVADGSWHIISHTFTVTASKYAWPRVAAPSNYGLSMCAYMLVEGDTPAAWAPAEGEILAGGGTLMSANLWEAENVTPAENPEGGIYTCSGIRGVRTNVALDRLAENQVFHCGFSVNPGADDVFSFALCYKDAASRVNYAFSEDTSVPAGKWTRVSASAVIPSGMTVYQMVICDNNNASGTSGWKVTNPVLSYGSPVVLAISEITATDVKDGKSPTVSVSKSGTVTTIVVTNADGSKTTQTVNDGVNGTPGAKGADGKTPYFHVKYSNDGGKTFTESGGETVGTYIGTCTDFNSADPTAVGSYTWAKIKGETGETGATGPQGVGAKSIVPQYYLSTSNTAQSGGSWVESCPAWTSGHYIWTRSKITWTNNSTTYTTPQLDDAINSASQTAKTAQGTAESAQGTANAAASTADSAKSAASNAQTAADSANTAASAAQAAADSAKSTANSAQSAADSAQSAANAAANAASTAQKDVDVLYENIHIDGEGMHLAKVDSDGKIKSTYQTLVSDKGMRVVETATGTVALKTEGDTVEAANLVSRETLSVNADGYKLRWTKFHSSVDGEDGIGAYWSKT